ncbi:hypothetical protein ASPBRDRAFT_54270 [Aspergillus brasiliensis CBS 101740]|uniref:Uncharacterized protein n=1 Tax=Aspergillus brasiliensis (strain CBS 101740 / IMI 381727 / IBT 21946) TaxID=767769 RepID=A0A1L9ULF5_ASPBC|nr:hypothetical protein ASPBRDRAFT_54270 [Aspergillus brasiliensis CBS 101740]
MLQKLGISERTDGDGDAFELYTAIPFRVLLAVRIRVDMTLPTPAGSIVWCKRPNAGVTGPSKLADTLDYSTDKAGLRASGLQMKLSGSRQRYGRVQQSGGIALFVTGTALDCLSAASKTGILPQLTRTILAHNWRHS